MNCNKKVKGNAKSNIFHMHCFYHNGESHPIKLTPHIVKGIRQIEVMEKSVIPYALNYIQYKHG